MKENRTQPFCDNHSEYCNSTEVTVLDQLDEEFWREVEEFVYDLAQYNISGEVSA
jgi:hypothetical protein